MGGIYGLPLTPSSSQIPKSQDSSAHEDVNFDGSTQDDDNSIVPNSDRQSGTPESQGGSNQGLKGSIALNGVELKAASEAGTNRLCSRRGKTNSKGKGRKATTKSHKRKTSPAKTTSPGKKRVSSNKVVYVANMMKELDPHLKDGGEEARENFATSLFDASTTKLTRSEAEALQNLAQDKFIPPRESLDVELLVKEQLTRRRGVKRYHQTDGKIPYHIHRSSEGHAGGVKKSQHKQVKMTDKKCRNAQGLHSSNRSMKEQEQMALDDRDKWDDRKSECPAILWFKFNVPSYFLTRLLRGLARINTLLSTPCYSASPTTLESANSMSGEPPCYLNPSKIPKDYNLSMEQGLHVFSPTRRVFEDFPNFLEIVENLAGRQCGVVKVVVPNGWSVNFMIHYGPSDY